MAPYDVIRVIVALVLLTAAALKGHQVATSPVAETGFLSSRWVLISVVEFELALGLWMLWGQFARQTRSVVIACLALFGAISLLRAVRGESSCGCFGTISINPWISAAFNAFAITALCCFEPVVPLHSLGKVQRSTAQRGLLSIFAFGAPALALMTSYRPATLATDGHIAGSGRIVVLEPEAWVGRRFPAIRHVDVGEQLLHGRWRLILYHNACPECLAALAHYQRLLRDPILQRSAQLAFLELPPSAQGRISPTHDPHPRWLHGVFDDEYEWFVQTPVEISLQSGIVVDVKLPADIRASISAAPPTDRSQARSHEPAPP